MLLAHGAGVVPDRAAVSFNVVCGRIEVRDANEIVAVARPGQLLDGGVRGEVQAQQQERARADQAKENALRLASPAQGLGATEDENG